MKRSLLQYIGCPLCGQALELRAHSIQGERVIEGTLKCGRCSTEYPIEKAIPNLIANHGWGESKASEMAGWVNLWAKKGMYGHTDRSLQDSYKLPYVGGAWQDTARWFDIVLDDLQLTGKEAILDLGAGQGWAARYFAAKGCRSVAMDIVADGYYGLGRSWAIMDHAGVYFEPILGDGENMPFYPGQFDVVFLSSALHHFEKVERVLDQIHRVLKPGGQIIAAPEPIISIFIPEQRVVGDIEEVREGITERRLTALRYWAALKKSGFQGIELMTFETYHAAPAQVYAWIGQRDTTSCVRSGPV